MHTKTLGASNLSASQLGLGCMGMSEFYGATNDTESEATLLRALELGINFFDTADMYGSGENEKLLGRVLKNHRSKIILATKFGFVRDPNNPDARIINAKPEYVKQACEASLKRLGVDIIDLYYLHRVDPNIPVEETVSAMAALVKSGKVKYIGLSEVNAETIQRAHKIHPITAVQTEYSLWFREPEKEVIPACEKLNITFVPYSPLGRGFLTNTISSPDKLDPNDFRKSLPRLKGDNLKSNLDLVAQFAELAKLKHCTPAQLALAWVLAKSPNIIPIPGTKRRKYLEENVAACSIKLTQKEISDLDNLFNTDTSHGDRYPEQGMKLVE